MQILRKSIGVAMLMALFAAPAAMAEERGFYGIVGFGQSKADIDASGFTVDDEDTYKHVGVGYSFSDHIALEGGYLDLGQASISASGSASGTYYGSPFSATGTLSATAEADGYYIGPRFTYPLNKDLGVYGKVGVYFWDLKATASASGSLTYKGTTYAANASASATDDGSDPYWGFGLNYRLNDRFSVRGEFTRYEVSDTDVDNLGVTLVVKF